MIVDLFDRADGISWSEYTIEAKIISMYAKGMTTGDIETHIKDLYGIEMSDR